MYLNDMKIGMKIDIPSAKVDRQQMLDFARLYDNIPLHTDEEYAKKTRFGGLIAPGVMSFMVVWAKFLENDIMGEELVAGKSTKIEWFRPVFADDELKGEAEITAITKRNEYNGIVEITIRVFNQNKELVLTDITEAIVKYRK